MTIQHNDFLEECAIFNVATGGGGGGGGPVSSVNGIGPDSFGNVYLTSDSIPQGTQNIFLTNDGGTTDNLATMPTITSLQSQINGKLSLSGGTMTGNLILNTDPSLSLQAATKQYVDNSISAAPYVLRAGDTMTGPLILNSDPTLPLQAVTKEYVDGLIVSGEYLKIANNLSDVASIVTSAQNIGASNSYLYISSSTVLTAPLPRRIGFNITAAGQTLQLPDATTLNPNVLGDILFLNNYSAYSVSVLDGTGAPIATLNPGSNYWYTPDSNSSVAGIWYFWSWIGTVNGSSSYNNLVDLNSAYAQTLGQNLTIFSGLNLLGGNLNIGGPNVSSNALLSLTSSTQGSLPYPTMTTAQMNAIPVTTADTGLIVYVTDLTDGLYYFDGAQWVYVANDSGAGNTLQSAYDAGNTIALTTGLPFYVSNQSGIANFVWLYSPGVPTPYNYSSLEGVQFTPNVNVSVTALQYVNQYFSSGSRQVAIFRTSDQSLIVSDLVYKTDPLDSTGHYRTHAINPVTLYAGVSYLVVGIVPANENWTFYSLSNPPNFNYTAITYGQNASTIVYPTTITNAPTAIYGNQSFQYSTVVSSVSINDGTQHALLNAYSTTQGFMQPVLNSTQEATLTGLLGSLDAGLQWFNSTTLTNNYWNGTVVNQGLTVQNINSGLNITLDKSIPGQVIINSTGSSSPAASYSSFSTGANGFVTLISATNTFYPVTLGTGFNSNDSSGFTNQFLTVSGVLTPVITSDTATTQFYNVNINLSARGATASVSTYVVCLFILQSGGSIIPTKYQSSLTLQDLVTELDISITGNVELNQGDSVFLQVQNTSSTNNLYFRYATASITSIAGSIPNTNGLVQGSNNIYLSQDGGATLQNVTGTPVVGNLAKFDTSSGKVIDSGAPASSLFTWQVVTGTTQQMAINTGYIVKSASPVTFTLPLTSAGIGAMEIVGTGTATWQVNTNAGQIIEYNGLTGSSSAQSGTANDSARIVYAGDGSGEFNIELSNGMEITLS